MPLKNEQYLRDADGNLDRIGYAVTFKGAKVLIEVPIYHFARMDYSKNGRFPADMPPLPNSQTYTP